MDERYHRLWLLAKERIARKAHDHRYNDEKRELLHGLLAELDIMEAEAVLEE